MNRKLDVGGTLSQVFSTYGQQAGVLLPLAFGLYLLVAIISGLFAGNFLLGLVAFGVGVIAATLYQGMVVSLVRDVQDGRRDSSVGQLVEETWPVVLPLVGAGILAGIGIAIGLVILVVPGLILLTIWSVIAPVIVVERSGAINAFGRSRALVKHNGWQVFGVIFVDHRNRQHRARADRRCHFRHLLRAGPIQPDRLDPDRADRSARGLDHLFQPDCPERRRAGGGCSSQRRSLAAITGLV
jgi:hypothetical protein